MPVRLLLLNGAVRGAAGNTARALEVAARHAQQAGHDVDVVHLAEFVGSVSALVARVRRADALLFGSGVYWASWGSPLQRFLELLTPYEATDVFVGKACGVVLTMDSVGGPDVAARLLYALSLMGCASPPFGSVILSRVGEQANDPDIWQLADLHVLVDNLCLMSTSAPKWKQWPVHPATPVDGPWPIAGPVDLGLPDFLLPAHTVVKP
jgi:multimeric flavodoxin WrbA